MKVTCHYIAAKVKSLSISCTCMVVTFESVYDTEPCLFTSSLWWIGGYYALASPAMGHWGTCPLDLQQCSFFMVLWHIHSLTATICWQSLHVNTW